MTTVHKVLIHSRQIIENVVLPVGCFGEDAAESRHKVYKSDRLQHARKSSRINNLSDVFNRALDTSDPLLSSISLTKRKNEDDYNFHQKSLIYYAAIFKTKKKFMIILMRMKANIVKEILT